MATTPYSIDRTTGTRYGTSPRRSSTPRFRPTSHQSTTTRQSNQVGPLPTMNSGDYGRGVLQINAERGILPSDAFRNLFMGTPPTDMGGAPSGGRGGGGGGGGGGGQAGVDPAAAAAYKAMLENMRNDTSVDDAWNSYIESMRGTYDPAKAAAKWDTAGGDIRGAGAAGRSRMGDIYQELLGRAATGRQAVAGAVSQGDQALQNIMARFKGASSQGAGNINNVLSNFDAGAMDPGVYQNELDSLFAAGMVGNQRMGNAYDVAFADRPQVYAGLNSDISSGMTAQEQAMLNQIAAKKAAEAQANEAQLAQVLGTAGISRAQAAQQRQQELLKLQAELADMGIQV